MLQECQWCIINIHTHPCVKTLKNESDVVQELLSKITVSCDSHNLSIKWLLNTILQNNRHDNYNKNKNNDNNNNNI